MYTMDANENFVLIYFLADRTAEKTPNSILFLKHQWVATEFASDPAQAWRLASELLS